MICLVTLSADSVDPGVHSWGNDMVVCEVLHIHGISFPGGRALPDCNVHQDFTAAHDRRGVAIDGHIASSFIVEVFYILREVRDLSSWFYAWKLTETGEVVRCFTM